MTEAQNPKRRKPIGEPILRSDLDLDLIVGAEPTPDETAELLARTERVSPLLAKLMQSKKVDDHAPGNIDA